MTIFPGTIADNPYQTLDNILMLAGQPDIGPLLERYQMLHGLPPTGSYRLIFNVVHIQLSRPDS